MRKFPFQRSFLKKQKVAKRPTKKKHRKKTKTKLSFSFFCFILLLFFLFKKNHEHNPKTSYTLKIDSSWNIKIDSNLGMQNYQKVLNKIKEKISIPLSLEQLAKELQKELFFAQTTILHTGQKQLSIYIEERTPLFLITADKNRFVSKEGQIYGLQGENEQNLPQLANILEEKRESYDFSNGGNLFISKEEEIRIEEALAILSLAKKFSLSLEKAVFIDYRGFKINFQEMGTEILMGRAPFDQKFVKLLEIKKQLEEKGQKADRIELDYDGKAFIKTSKKGENVDS